MLKIEEMTTPQILETIPHGSGINCDWKAGWKRDKVYLSNSFQCMNENGYYDGYADFTLVIPFSEPDKFKLHFNGRQAQYLNRKYQLRDYLEGTFNYWISCNFGYLATVSENK